MLNVIAKKKSNTGELIYLVQSTNTKKFGVGEYDSNTDKIINISWFFNFQKATEEYHERVGETSKYEKQDLYTMDDWKRDGTLKLKKGQCVSNEIIDELKNSMPPKAYSLRCFQPGEVRGQSADGDELYRTFTIGSGCWVYLGLCKAWKTDPEETLYNNMNENKNTMKLSENKLNSLIKESVNKILNEIGDTRRGRYKMGCVMGRQLKRGQQDDEAIISNMNSTAFRLGLYDEKPLMNDKDYLKQFDSYLSKYGRRERENRRLERKNKLTESQLNKIIKESVNTIISKLNEDFDPYGIVEWNHFDNDNFDTDYYDGFVVVDLTGAVLGNFDNYDDAVEYAREKASNNKYGTYEVYGCDENGYALEKDYPEDNTLVYSTDQDFN